MVKKDAHVHAEVKVGFISWRGVRPAAENDTDQRWWTSSLLLYLFLLIRKIPPGSNLRAGSCLHKPHGQDEMDVKLSWAPHDGLPQLPIPRLRSMA